jgi:hypothetical protein
MASANARPAPYPVNPSEVLFSVSFALTRDGKRRFGQVDNLMAVLTAHHLLDHLERSGFVVVQKPPAVMHAALTYGKGMPSDG